MKTALVLCLAVSVLAGCGENDPPPAPASELSVEAEVTDLDPDAPEHAGRFPAQDPEASEERGHPVIPVDDRADADRLCERAQKSPPYELADETQVTFDIPGTGADVTCMLPAG